MVIIMMLDEDVNDYRKIYRIAGSFLFFISCLYLCLFVSDDIKAGRKNVAYGNWNFSGFYLSAWEVIRVY